MRHHWPQSWVTTIMLFATALHSISPTLNRFDPDMSDKKILDELVDSRRYDKRLRPGGVSSLTFEDPCVTVVEVNVIVISVSSPDESSLKYELEFLLNQTWKDPRLQYEDEGRHEYLNGIHHQEHLWLPDTYFVKHGDYKQMAYPTNISLRIFKNSTINFILRRRLSLSCEGDLHIFPFDDPKCSFSVESISYEARELVYKWTSEIQPLAFLPNMHVLNAYKRTNKTAICNDGMSWRGNYSCLQVHLTFTRDRSFYFSTVFIPGMLLVTSSFITFWLEWNAVPGRVMLGVTTMLNFFTTSNNFRSNLPVVSSLTAMNVWDGVCMCFIYASLLEFVAVNYLGRKKPRTLRYYRPAATNVSVRQNKDDQVGNHDGFSCTTCPPNKCIHMERLTPPAASQEIQREIPFFELAHPLRVAKTIDVVSRAVFPVAYGLFLIFFFARYNGFS